MYHFLRRELVNILDTKYLKYKFFYCWSFWIKVTLSVTKPPQQRQEKTVQLKWEKTKILWDYNGQHLTYQKFQMAHQSNSNLYFNATKHSRFQFKQKTKISKLFASFECKLKTETFLANERHVPENRLKSLLKGTIKCRTKADTENWKPKTEIPQVWTADRKRFSIYMVNSSENKCRTGMRDACPEILYRKQYQYSNTFHEMKSKFLCMFSDYMSNLHTGGQFT